jgi:hypothetical protein
MHKLYSENEKAAILEKAVDLLENKKASNVEAKKRRPKMANEKLEGKENLTVNGKGKENFAGKDIVIVVLAVAVLFLGFWAIKKCPEAPAAPVKVATPVKKAPVKKAPVAKVAAPVKVVAPEMLTITIVNNLNNPVRVIKVDQYGRDQVLIEKLIPKTPAYIDVPVAGRGDFMSLKAESHCWLEGISEKSRTRLYQFRDANRNLLLIQPPVWVIGG